jgi:predicted dehydrogenase
MAWLLGRRYVGCDDVTCRFIKGVRGIFSPGNTAGLGQGILEAAPPARAGPGAGGGCLHQAERLDETMVIEAIGRRLRLAVVGGGPGSVIGEVHRIAARLDGCYEIVASALSSDPERARRTGVVIGVPEDRAYPSARVLIETEAKRADRADVIAVMTPNDSHYEICSLALEAGFHVICDKPLTTNLALAVDLARKVKATGAEFCLTHCYTGYPMVRQARAMVRAGAIGPIRQLHLQYVQGYLASEDVPPGWRLDPARIGGSMILMDIGTHAHHLGAYVTGLDLESLCADVGHVVPGRQVDDYASLLLRYTNGARGSMWVTNAASGAEHGLSFRIFGETGGLEWHQEEPNRLVHRKRDGLEEVVTRRKDALVSEDAQQVTRVEIGHPEGYLEAFANLYSDFARAVVARMRHEPPDQIDRPFPTVEDGVKGLAFVEAAAQSSALRSWKSVDLPQI